VDGKLVVSVCLRCVAVRSGASLLVLVTIWRSVFAVVHRFRASQRAVALAWALADCRDGCLSAHASLAWRRRLPRTSTRLVAAPCLREHGERDKKLGCRVEISKVVIFLHHSGASEESLGRMTSDFFRLSFTECCR